MSRAAGWYPAPDESFVFRWWDGSAWTDGRSVWWPTLQRAGRWHNAAGFTGRSTLWVLRHPMHWVLLTIVIWMAAGATVLLVFGTVPWGFAITALIETALLGVLPVRVGRRRWDEAVKQSLTPS